MCVYDICHDKKKERERKRGQEKIAIKHTSKESKRDVTLGDETR